MVEIARYGIVCECCMVAIANDDRSGCVDYWGHTTKEHPKPIGGSPGCSGPLVPSCGSESDDDCTNGENDDDHIWTCSYLTETCISCLGDIMYGAKYFHVAQLDH